ncbi:MAG: large-conductance mechanosensitive channel protein MscL [Planctomycetota bacterium]|nr:large-conductance mechanosensitive channel protein MscL [Planctomycetota bacterium]
MFKEFKEFAIKGNMLDMAVGIIIGGAFGGVVSSLVKDVIMPPIGLLLGKVDFGGLFVNLSGTSYASLAEAQKANAATLNYGFFINTLINFIVVAFAVFVLVKQINRLKHAPAPAAAATKDCPQCLSKVPLNAKKCAFCTSQL